MPPAGILVVGGPLLLVPGRPVPVHEHGAARLQHGAHHSPAERRVQQRRRNLHVQSGGRRGEHARRRRPMILIVSNVAGSDLAYNTAYIAGHFRRSAIRTTSSATTSCRAAGTVRRAARHRRVGFNVPADVPQPAGYVHGHGRGRGVGPGRRVQALALGAVGRLGPAAGHGHARGRLHRGDATPRAV